MPLVANGEDLKGRGPHGIPKVLKNYSLSVGRQDPDTAVDASRPDKAGHHTANCMCAPPARMSACMLAQRARGTVTCVQTTI